MPPQLQGQLGRVHIGHRGRGGGEGGGGGGGRHDVGDGGAVEVMVVVTGGGSADAVQDQAGLQAAAGHRAVVAEHGRGGETQGGSRHASRKFRLYN